MRGRSGSSLRGWRGFIFICTLVCLAMLVVDGAPGTAGALSATTPWRPMTTPYVASPHGDSILTGVSCPTTRLCLAVGIQNADSSDASPATPLAEVWNGRWKVSPVAKPVVAPNASVYLLGVSCGLPTYCMAVGVAGVGNPTSGFAELWNGSAWSVTLEPSGSYLHGVSCVGTDCVAVGSVADFWNGQSWTIDSSASGDFLMGASCVSSDHCLAVGYNNANNTPRSAADYFDGTWSEELPPNAANFQSSFGGVSCLQAAPALECMAVGNDPFSSVSDSLSASVWDSATSGWTVTSPTAPRGTVPNFHGVSCATLSRCVAVGGSVGYFDNRPFAATWNGSAWSVMNTSQLPVLPNSNQNFGFDAVSCPSSTFCVTVGTKPALNGPEPLAASWGTVP